MTTPTVNGTPKLEVERGTVYDVYTGLPLVFNRDGQAEIWDHDEPTVEELQSMLNADGKARSLEQVLSLPIRAADWSIKPGDSTSDIANWLIEFLQRPPVDGGMQVPFQQIIGQFTSSFVNRRSYHEKVFTQVDGRLVYDKLAWRPAQSCVLIRDPKTGQLEGFKQQVLNRFNGQQASTSGDGYVTIPAQYAVIHIHNGHRDPVRGVSDFEVAYRCHKLKQKVSYLWFSYLENSALPKIIAKTAGEAEAKTVAKAIASLRNNGVAALPSQWLQEVTALNVSGSGAEQFQQALAWLDSQASISLLASFTDLASAAISKGVGSYALSKDLTDNFLRQLQGYAAEISATVVDQVLRDLVAYNFGPSAPVPDFSIGPLNPEDNTQAMQMLQALAVGQGGQLNVPVAFVDNLTMEVARGLGMDLDELRRAIDTKNEQLQQQANNEQEAQLAKLLATANTGAQAVSDAQSTAATPTAGVAEPGPTA